MSMTVAASNPAWTITDYLEVRDGHLAINGADALELVRKFDSPLFVFSEPRISSNIDRLKSAAASVSASDPFFLCLESQLKHGRAQAGARCRASTLKSTAAENSSKHCASAFVPIRSFSTAPARAPSELDDAVRAGIHAINVDSIYEIGLVEEAVRRVAPQMASR